MKNKMLSLTLVLSVFILSSIGRTKTHILKLENADGHYFTDAEISRLQEKSNQINIDPNASKRILPEWVKIEIRSRGGLDNYSPQMMDLTLSYLGVMFGQDTLAYMNNIENVRKSTTVFSMNAKISMIPTALRGSAQNKANEKIDQEAEKIKSAYLATAAIQIHNQVQNLVSNEGLTGSQAELVEAQFVSTAKNQIDQAVNANVEAAKNKVDERLDEVQKELSFQEISIRVAHKLIEKDNGALIIFGEIGKDVVDMNFDTKTGLRGASIFAQVGTRGMSVQATPQGNLGVEWITNNNIKISLQAFFFHGRGLIVSGARGVYNVTQMSDAAYDQHTDLFNIDSNSQKFSIKIPSRMGKSEDQIYVATGNFATGNGSQTKSAVGFGVIVRVLPMVSLQVEGSFNRPQFDSAITEAIVIDNIDSQNRLAFYIANENVKGLVSAYDRSETVATTDISEVSIGVKYLLYKFSRAGVVGQLSTSLEYRGIYESRGLTDNFDAGGGLGVGVESNINY